MSPEHAKPGAPPVPGWSPARTIAWPVWTEQATALLGFLWVNTAAFFAAGFLFGNYGLIHNLGHGSALLVFAVAGSMHRFKRSARTIAVSLGLLTAASLLVHLTGGLIEAHFY